MHRKLDLKGFDINDLELIEQILAGQKELYAELILRYQKKVIGSCLFKLQNPIEAQEAAHDVFVKAYRSLGEFKGISSFSTWLFRITANHCQDVLRGRTRRRTVSLNSLVEDDGDQVYKLIATTPMAATQLENKDLTDKILSAMPLHYRDVLTLREVEGLDYNEIAKVMDCSPGAVTGRLSHARKHLRKNLSLFIREKDGLLVNVGLSQRGQKGPNSGLIKI